MKIIEKLKAVGKIPIDFCKELNLVFDPLIHVIHVDHLSLPLIAAAAASI